MGRTSGRSAEDTRRLILEAATRAIRDHGTGATLDLIAREAGISKGGVLYHFTGKDPLLAALAQDEFDRFRACVLSQIDPRDPARGRLLRAYVRASLLPQDADESRERFVVIAQLLVLPAVQALVRADEARWQAELEQDGVPETARLLVVAAADGVAGAPLWAAEYPSAARERLQRELLAMIDAADAGALPPSDGERPVRVPARGPGRNGPAADRVTRV